MKKNLVLLLIISLLSIGAMAGTVVSRGLYQSFFGQGKQTFSGRIVKVADGDTVTLLDASKTQMRIRLLGIDAPEKNQAYGTRSKQNLSNLVYEQNVQADCIGQDRYGRYLCKILINGIDANFEQVKAGLAWHYKHYQNSQSSTDRRAYAKAERDARSRKLGLWNDPSPIPPWSFRKTH